MRGICAEATWLAKLVALQERGDALFCLRDREKICSCEERPCDIHGVLGVYLVHMLEQYRMTWSLL